MIEIKHKDTGKVLRRVSTLDGADLISAFLSGADLAETDLRRAYINEADLGGAYLSRAYLTYTKLTGSNLSGADLSETYLRYTDLTGANLTGALLCRTSFTFCDTLHLARGLELIQHRGPSSLDAFTLRASINHLPDIFLKGVGYNDHEIDYLRSMYAGGPMGGGIQYYSCFLSYAHLDNAFADKLHADLTSRENDVSVWRDKNDIPTGTKWNEEISKGIRAKDKLMLVCSRRSVYRPQVVREILEAIQHERETGTKKFFPINLDGHLYSDEMMEASREKVRSGEWGENWVHHVRKYQSADFTRWEKPDAYAAALARLLKDLKNPSPR